MKLFLSILLFPLLCFSQKAIILNKDTLCTITIPQVTKINLTYLDLEQCAAERDSLLSILKDYKSEKQVYERTITRLQGLNSDYMTVLNNQQEIILNLTRGQGDWQKKYVRMVNLKNVELVVIPTLVGYIVWRISK